MKKIVLARQVKPLYAVLTATLDPFFDYADSFGDYDDDDNEGSPLRYRLLIVLDTGVPARSVQPSAAEEIVNEIDLNNLILNVADWRTLSDHALTATDDEVVGTIRLFGSASPVELGKIEFRERDGHRFLADMTLLLDMGGTGANTVVGLDLTDVPVTFEGLRFYLELLPDERPNAEEARRFMEQFVPPGAYQHTPTFDDEWVYFAPETYLDA